MSRAGVSDYSVLRTCQRETSPDQYKTVQYVYYTGAYCALTLLSLTLLLAFRDQTDTNAPKHQDVKRVEKWCQHEPEPACGWAPWRAGDLSTWMFQYLRLSVTRCWQYRTLSLSLCLSVSPGQLARWSGRKLHHVGFKSSPAAAPVGVRRRWHPPSCVFSISAQQEPILWIRFSDISAAGSDAAEIRLTSNFLNVLYLMRRRKKWRWGWLARLCVAFNA